MRSTVRTAALRGVDAVRVDVEADVGPGLPSFSIVGMADAAVKEARERVRSAVKAAGFVFPSGRVVVNLAPAPLRKRGTGFDLPIAAAILVATGQLSSSSLADTTLVGELSLDGHVREVTGLLAHAVEASRSGSRLLGPHDSSAPARHVLKASYVGLRHLSEVSSQPDRSDDTTHDSPQRETRPEVDMSVVAGQQHAKRALEISAVGGHNLLFEGPPGAGKTLLARCLPGILPVLDEEQRLETALIHAVAGLDESRPLGGIRPFRSPHHASTRAGLIGGGTPPRPGEASLAHNGVLFLDELNEFSSSVLQTLRQPLEDGRVTLVRADGVAVFPSRFSLIGARNPCPCGFLGDGTDRCGCPPAAIERYRRRVGGPLMDRIDMVVRLDRVPPGSFAQHSAGEGSYAVAQRVDASIRFGCGDGSIVRGLTGRALLDALQFDSEAVDALTSSGAALRTSARGLTRVARVARSIADIDLAPRVAGTHVLEAFTYRPGAP